VSADRLNIHRDSGSVEGKSCPMDAGTARIMHATSAATVAVRMIAAGACHGATLHA